MLMLNPTSNIHSGWHVDYWCDKRNDVDSFYDPLESVLDLSIPYTHSYIQQIESNANLCVTSLELF